MVYTAYLSSGIQDCSVPHGIQIDTNGLDAGHVGNVVQDYLLKLGEVKYFRGLSYI